MSLPILPPFRPNPVVPTPIDDPVSRLAAAIGLPPDILVALATRNSGGQPIPGIRLPIPLGLGGAQPPNAVAPGPPAPVGPPPPAMTSAAGPASAAATGASSGAGRNTLATTGGAPQMGGFRGAMSGLLARAPAMPPGRPLPEPDPRDRSWLAALPTLVAGIGNAFGGAAYANTQQAEQKRADEQMAMERQRLEFERRRLASQEQETREASAERKFRMSVGKLELTQSLKELYDGQSPAERAKLVNPALIARYIEDGNMDLANKALEGYRSKAAIERDRTVASAQQFLPMIQEITGDKTLTAEGVADTLPTTLNLLEMGMRARKAKWEWETRLQMSPEDRFKTLSTETTKLEELDSDLAKLRYQKSFAQALSDYDKKMSAIVESKDIMERATAPDQLAKAKWEEVKADKQLGPQMAIPPDFYDTQIKQAEENRKSRIEMIRKLDPDMAERYESRAASNSFNQDDVNRQLMDFFGLATPSAMGASGASATPPPRVQTTSVTGEADARAARTTGRLRDPYPETRAGASVSETFETVGRGVSRAAGQAIAATPFIVPWAALKSTGLDATLRKAENAELDSDPNFNGMLNRLSRRFAVERPGAPVDPAALRHDAALWTWLLATGVDPSTVPPHRWKLGPLREAP